MQRNKVEVKRLLSEYSNGTIQKSEFKELQDYLKKGHPDAELNGLFAELFEEMDLDPDLMIESNSIYNNVIHHPQFDKKPGHAGRGNLWWFAGATAAAAILFVVCKIFLFPLHPFESLGKPEGRLVKQAPSQVESTAKKAILRLANGTEIDLDQSEDGIIAIENNMEISLNGTELRYKNDPAGLENGKNLVNTISTTKGRQFQVILPDGTKMWLNALSSLTYPVHFNSKTRNVTLTGEGYFEVEKAKDWPFIVHTRTQEVRVLGTHFNISAYDEDDVFKTTLVEGKLKVTALTRKAASSSGGATIDEHSLLLQPGQQAITYKENDKLIREQVDTEEVISWKRNLFVFNNEEVSEVIKKVMRWYDVKIICREDMEGIRIGGTIPRFEKIEQLMDALEATGLLHYHMKGGQVVIMK